METWERSRNLALTPALMLSTLSVSLLFIRMLYLENGRFSFMAWNLALAWIQLGLSYGVVWSIRNRGWMRWQTFGLGVLWLSFLPNSFYIVTDFIHLRVSQPQTFLYDAVLCTSFALTGLILGCISLFSVHQELTRTLREKWAWFIVLSILLLSSFGIYLGRYLGWNSWDLLANPFYILFDLMNRLTNREDLRATLITTGLFFAFNACVYGTFFVSLQSVKRQK